MPPCSGNIPKAAGETALQKNVWPHRLIMALVLPAAAATLFDAPGTTGVFDTLLLLLATAGSISALVRQLPLQSVLFAAFITALIGTAAHGLSERTGIPLGPLSFGETVGPQLFNTVPWSVGLIWIIAIFNSRGVARLVLRPWRKVRTYGFLLMGLTAGLALVFDLALEPYAHVKRFWFWHPTKIPFTWHGASPMSFIGWTFVALIILAVIMPFLIRKQPGKSSRPDFNPLVIWIGALALFGVAAAQAGYWTAAGVDAAAAVVVTIFSWRGAKW